MSGRRALLLALLLMAVGAAIRVGGLDTRGMGHLEMYAPNLPLPEGLSIPPPRPTLLKTLTGSMWEVHPPAWYLLYWPWTRVTGTSATALRLPSALFGTVSLWLIWILARRERGEPAAVLATMLLTFSGAHVMWSQIARPVVLASMLGLASSALLARVVTSPRRALLLMYLATTAVGLATEYYYWFVFGGQIVWVLLVSARRRYRAHALLRWQFLVLMLVSPLITLATSQSRPSYLSDAIASVIFRYVGFGFLLGPAEDTAGLVNPLWVSAVLIGAACLVASMAVGSGSDSSDGLDEPEVPPTLLLGAVIVVAMVAIVAESFLLSASGMGTRGKLLPTVVVPLLIAGVLHAAMALLRGLPWRPAAVPPLTLVLALVPAGAVFGVSALFPFLDPKYFLLFTPFLCVVLADGMVGTWNRMRAGWRWVGAGALAIWLALALVGSVRYFGGVDATPIDFRGLARQLTPELRETDRILVFRHYAMTPLFYYVPATPNRYVAEDYARTMSAVPRGRVWLISLQDSLIADPEDMRAAVGRCQLARTLRSTFIRAELYESCPPVSE